MPYLLPLSREELKLRFMYAKRNFMGRYIRPTAAMTNTTTREYVGQWKPWQEVTDGLFLSRLPYQSDFEKITALKSRTGLPVKRIKSITEYHELMQSSLPGLSYFVTANKIIDPAYWEEHHFRQRILLMQDHTANAADTEIMNVILEILHDKIINQQATLMHCQVGIGRSGAIAVTFKAIAETISVEEAYGKVQTAEAEEERRSQVQSRDDRIAKAKNIIALFEAKISPEEYRGDSLIARMEDYIRKEVQKEEDRRKENYSTPTLDTYICSEEGLTAISDLPSFYQLGVLAAYHTPYLAYVRNEISDALSALFSQIYDAQNAEWYKNIFQPQLVRLEDGSAINMDLNKISNSYPDIGKALEKFLADIAEHLSLMLKCDPQAWPSLPPQESRSWVWQP